MAKSDGYTCECCGQYVKEYKRRLYKGPTIALIRLYKLDKADPDNFHHILSIGATADKGVGDFAKARYWGLIEALPNDDDYKRTSGYWAITLRGKRFVQGRIRIPEYCHIFNSEARRFSGGKISIVDAVGTRFDYLELMNT